MSECAMCSVGGGPCGEKPFRVRVAGGEKELMCGYHGRIIQFGEALLALGVERSDAVFAELGRLVRAGGCTTPRAPGAEGQTPHPVRGGVQPAALGVPDGVAVS